MNWSLAGFGFLLASLYSHFTSTARPRRRPCVGCGGVTRTKDSRMCPECCYRDPRTAPDPFDPANKEALGYCIELDTQS